MSKKVDAKADKKAAAKAAAAALKVRQAKFAAAKYGPAGPLAGPYNPLPALVAAAAGADPVAPPPRRGDALLRELLLHPDAAGAAPTALVFTAPEHETWSKGLADYVFTLTKANMEAHYNAAPEWGWRDGKKRGELIDTDMRYILLQGLGEGGEAVVAPGAPALLSAPRTPLEECTLGFAAYRFEQEDDGVDALYVYELQVAPTAQRRGVGKRLMGVLEAVAVEAGMNRIMLTVLRGNAAAVAFYEGLGFVTDPSCPSFGGEEEGEEPASYRILSKPVGGAAAAEAPAP